MEQQAWAVVIGGGASGMLAAITAAETLQKQKRTERIVVLEKEPRIGRKLLATGNGRCNLSNQSVDASHYHGGRNWASSLLTQYPTKSVIRRFEQMGLLCRTDEEGRVYPYNLQSSAVLEILRLQMEYLGIEVVCDAPVSQIEKRGSVFLLTTPEGVWKAERVILAAGGKAAPKLGSDGSGTKLAKSLGHTVVKEYPALVQLESEPKRMKVLKGMRSQAEVSLLENGKVVLHETGEVQFTEYGLSGICVFQLSGRANRSLDAGKCVELTLNLMPEYRVEMLTKQIAGQSKRYPDLPSHDILCGFLNQRVGQGVVKEALGERAPKTAGELTFEDARKIAETVQDFRFPVTGSRGWEHAQVTAGGVDCREVNGETMESRKCAGLYLCGEVLDVDGDCGGFNLHWAWSSGMAAGRSCAKKQEETT